MGRAPCCDKANVKRGPWSPEEDAKLKSYIDQHGTGGNWIALPQKIGLKRCGKSCRLRWLNYLRPNLKHGGFSEEEENIICRLYISIGSRWSIMAAQLPGRTDNDIKNYWNTRLKKKLFGEQPRKNHHHHQTRKISFEKQESNRCSADGDLCIISNGAAAAAREKETWEPQQILVDPVRHEGTNLGSSSSSPPFLAGASSSLLCPLDCSQDPASSSSQQPQGISEISAGSAAKLDELFHFGSVNPGGLDCFYEEGMAEHWTFEQLWDLQECCLTSEEPVRRRMW